MKQSDVIADVVERLRRALEASGARADAAIYERVKAESTMVWGSPSDRRAIRDQRIVERYKSNAPLTRIAQAEGISTRHALRVIKRR